MAYDFAICKVCTAEAGRLTYRLEHLNLWVCSRCGAHYVDHLDPVETMDPTVSPDAPDAQSANYFETIQHYNYERTLSHVEMIRSRCELEGLRVLDVGCGGGLFLSLLADGGADVCGSDLSDPAVRYARTKYGLTVHKYPVEHPFWQESYGERFDVITLWDVLEHVNFPRDFLRAAGNLLRPGGWMFIDTPCRESFYHRFGSMTYRASMGRFPTFLNVIYSNVPFGHKQILSAGELRGLLDRVGFETIELNMIHELSLPYTHYLKMMSRSKVLVSLAHPLVKILFSVLRIRNKMVAVGIKRKGSASC
jgi:2-polyprenyl-6-hydroxyphenyl methylase/3-demethylubiquinone-9 3-methyltransferase